MKLKSVKYNFQHRNYHIKTSIKSMVNDINARFKIKINID